MLLGLSRVVQRHRYAKDRGLKSVWVGDQVTAAREAITM
jgi:hypothetical protein